MTHLYRAKVQSSGYIGGPGVNVIYFSSGTPPVEEGSIAQYISDEVETIYTALKDGIVNDAQIDPLDSIDVIDVASGDLVNVFTVPEPFEAIAGGSGSSLCPRSLAICAIFRTDMFLHGRRLLGRSFIGPAGANTSTDNGQLSTEARTRVEEAYAAVTSGIGPRLAVYHRPTKDPISGANNNDGAYGDVVTVSTPTTASSLRSRRL